MDCTVRVWDMEGGSVLSLTTEDPENGNPDALFLALNFMTKSFQR